MFPVIFLYMLPDLKIMRNKVKDLYECFCACDTMDRRTHRGGGCLDLLFRYSNLSHTFDAKWCSPSDETAKQTP